MTVRQVKEAMEEIVMEWVAVVAVENQRQEQMVDIQMVEQVAQD